MRIGRFYNADYGHILDLHSEKSLSSKCLFCTHFCIYISQSKRFFKDRLNLGPINSIPMCIVKRGAYTCIWEEMNGNVHGSIVYNLYYISPKDLEWTKLIKICLVGHLLWNKKEKNKNVFSAVLTCIKNPNHA